MRLTDIPGEIPLSTVPEITPADLEEARATTIEMNRLIGEMNGLRILFGEMSREYDGLDRKLTALSQRRHKLLGNLQRVVGEY